MCALPPWAKYITQEHTRRRVENMCVGRLVASSPSCIAARCKGGKCSCSELAHVYIYIHIYVHTSIYIYIEYIYAKSVIFAKQGWVLKMARWNVRM